MYNPRTAPEGENQDIEQAPNQLFLSQTNGETSKIISSGETLLEQSLFSYKSTNDLLTRELDEKTFRLIQNNQSNVLFRPKKKVSRKRRVYSQVHMDPKKSGRRFRANDRERRRMESLNSALDALKGCIPVPKNNKRMTKLRVLRYACNYIKSLSDLLEAAAGRLSHHPDDGSGERRINGLSVGQRLEILSHTGRYYQHI